MAQEVQINQSTSCFGTGLCSLLFENKLGSEAPSAPRTPGSVLLLWMENCGAEMVC